MSAAFTADLYRDPATDQHYVLIFAWSELERDTNAAECECTEYSGPLTAAQLSYVVDTRHTSQLDWTEDLPDEWTRWEEVQRIWADPYGGSD